MLHVLGQDVLDVAQLGLRLLNRVAAPRIPRTPQRFYLVHILHTRLLHRFKKCKWHAPPCIGLRHRQIREIVAVHAVKEPLLKRVRDSRRARLVHLGQNRRGRRHKALIPWLMRLRQHVRSTRHQRQHQHGSRHPS